MRTARKMVTVMGGGQTYEQRVLALEPWAYWPLDDAVGSTTAREVVNGWNSSSLTNVTFGAAGIGDGNTAALTSGAAGTGIVLPAASMAATYPDDEGTMAMWLKIPAAVWTDGAQRSTWMFYGDGSNVNKTRKNASEALSGIRSGSGTADSITVTYSGTDWFILAMTWSVAGDALKLFINGAQVGATQTGIGAWNKALAIAVLAREANGTEPFSGSLAHAMLFSRVLTTDELLALASF